MGGLKLLLASAVALLAIGLTACGGGNDPTATTAPSTANGSATAKEQGVKGKAGKQSAARSKQTQTAKQSPAEDSPSPFAKKAAAAVPPVKVSGGGSVQFRTKGGDNSIQDYGEESDETELREAARALHDFYVARAEEDWARACSYLAARLVKQFEQFASRTRKLDEPGCAGVLHAFTRPLPPSLVRETMRIDAASLRREGEQAFLIFQGSEGTVYAIPMTEEDGEWKVAGLSGTPIS